MGEAAAAVTTPNASAPGTKSGNPTMSSLMRFFIPLGFAACLVSITHSIIHSTLSKASNPEIAIAAYALGASLFGLTERPAVLVRQTCSALVRDRVSFRAMSGVTWILIGATVAFGALICYTPVGAFVFRDVYGVDVSLVPAIVSGYQFFMWVSVFSALRCLYHGVIISQMRTKWVTIGMIVRLAGMFALSQYFIRTDTVTGGWVGAFIFAAGMLIEAGVCYWEGRSLTRKLPERVEDHGITSKRHIFGFYRPLLYSSFIVIAVAPATNALLGKTLDVELSIASFAVASSVFGVIMSVFTYIHQIVLNFYPTSPRLVFRFQRFVGFAPGLLTAAIFFTPAGAFLLDEVMGLTGRLLPATLDVMKVYALLALVLPWVDFGNGFLMLFRRTHVFMWSQAANTAASLTVLVSLVFFLPEWNGVIGPLVLTAGSAAELAVVATALYRARWDIGWARPARGK
ncbi:multi antimicrobial extrusion protein MatE [Paenibacillus sp.]|uniref:multi antimicrobial extrusion protein MatE n=1 Tax=Paenibacillus sp. TaxID=58172 RepID=UPI002811A427|nr:multi antimicrobial extrusion protein MatE [Paenibacillus sp.]